MGPFPLEEMIGSVGTYLLYLLIGIGFGVCLEMVGFGRSTKLTAQFYLRDMTVFKVMFSAVLVAMVLVFGAAGLGLLDYDRLWVPETYLIPGTLGGFLDWGRVHHRRLLSRHVDRLARHAQEGRVVLPRRHHGRHRPLR